MTEDRTGQQDAEGQQRGEPAAAGAPPQEAAHEAMQRASVQPELMPEVLPEGAEEGVHGAASEGAASEGTAAAAQDTAGLADVPTEPSGTEAASEETPSHETPSHETPSHETPSHETPSHETPSEQAPIEQAPIEQAPREQAPREQAPREQAPIEQAPREQAGSSETDAEPVKAVGTAPAVPTPAALAGAARPGPRPTPRPVPTPAVVRRPSLEAAAPAAGAADADAARLTRELAERARQWGRVAGDGAVFVRTADGEREVGAYPGTSEEEALAFFARKYEDLVAQLDLAEQRLAVPEAPVKDVARALDNLRPTLIEANVVGDLEALQRRLTALDERVVTRRKEAEERRAQAKEAARTERLALVEEAERISATDPEKMQWKPSGDRLRALFDQWKTAQRSGQRLDKPVEDELWKRFSQARTTFDRNRRAHFGELEKRHNEVKAVKAKIVAEAEALSTSRDWGPTSAAFRALMDRWKAAGRASRKDDDALWAQFRAAQDTFFSARAADQAQVDAEFRGNLEVKERLLAEAEALIPIKDLEATKRALRSIHDRWDAAGKVPRGDLGRVERRLKAVEDAVRQADEARWRRRNPEAKARAEGALGQLEESIAGLEADLRIAQERGDERAIRTAEEALAARRAWLQQVRQAASEFS